MAEESLLESNQVPGTVNESAPEYALYGVLKDLCMNNAQYFESHDNETGVRLHGAFLALIDHIKTVKPAVDYIRKASSSYDFDENTPGNGYASFVSVVDACIRHGVKLCKQVCINRESFFFRASYYMREVEACSHLLASLVTCLTHLRQLMEWSEPGELFPSGDHSPQDLLAKAESINQYCFYGRCLGFQFCESVQTVLKAISIAMASYSDVYYGEGGFVTKATNTVWNGGKYFMDPELRARRIVNISQYADVHFCKSFWFLAESEVMQRLPMIVCPALIVNKVISIPPEPLQHTRSDGSVIQIPVPTVHIGPQPLLVRLMSAVWREGMVGEAGGKADIRPPSPALIFHCHGGGFVAQSSSSHEPYLRDWARRLGVPIFSIDYSLAPEAPFPRALDELVYAYCWALNNCHLLGSTAQRVVLVGDSAGANLNMGLALKCIELGLQPPVGLFMAYAPVLVSFVPSPSRLLCLMDPLLPFGFMMRCLKAYASPKETKETLSKSGATSVDESADLAEMGLAATNENDTVEAETALEAVEASFGMQSSGVPTAGSDTESFEEVSESDLAALAALSVGGMNARQLLQPEADQISPMRYVLDMDTDSEGHQIPVLRACPGEVAEENVIFQVGQRVDGYGIQERVTQMADSLASTVSSSFSSLLASKASSPTNSNECDMPRSTWSQLDALMQRSPTEEFKFSVPRDPYLSPYWASDDVLKQLPPVSVLSAQFDPCLDDCVMLAKKLRGLGNNVTLDVLEGLPHGFLNFSLLSKEAHEGSKLCVKRIMNLLKLESPPDCSPNKSPS
ncbi:Hormone-sensitive lipase [Frankliniella fusca]|uniref:Hormone-sensitive lipase n=1 Tax=Frankliniella fusca TaxID=407009 RepID=A0AAE1H3A4_9NEOP|nr:Hormone-sensitive lipase [Frankliniella fusca]